MEVRRRTAILRWGDGRIVTVNEEQGWRCDHESLQEVLNMGWPTGGADIPRRRDMFASMVGELAKIFSADLIEFSDRPLNSEVPHRAA
jgi:hypothetical protein